MAIKFTAQVKGLDEMLSGLLRIPEEIKTALMSGLLESAAHVRGEAVRLIQTGGRSGKVYSYGQASAPGEAPKNVTGDLANSIKVGYGKRFLQVQIYSEHPAALIFEFGPTKRIAKRPFLQPALDGSADKIEAIMADAVQRGLDRAS